MSMENAFIWCNAHRHRPQLLHRTQPKATSVQDLAHVVSTWVISLTSRTWWWEVFRFPLPARTQQLRLIHRRRCAEIASPWHGTCFSAQTTSPLIWRTRRMVWTIKTWTCLHSRRWSRRCSKLEFPQSPTLIFPNRMCRTLYRHFRAQCQPRSVKMESTTSPFSRMTRRKEFKSLERFRVEWHRPPPPHHRQSPSSSRRTSPTTLRHHRNRQRPRTLQMVRRHQLKLQVEAPRRVDSKRRARKHLVKSLDRCSRCNVVWIRLFNNTTKFCRTIRRTRTTLAAITLNGSLIASPRRFTTCHTLNTLSVT